jgi:membrane carboxypeptidase/penicillin-binding protein PbpC
VVPGAVFRKAPGAVMDPAITLRVRGTVETVDWLVNGVRAATLDPGQRFEYRLGSVGSYRILAVDASGRYASVDVSRAG